MQLRTGCHESQNFYVTFALIAKWSDIGKTFHFTLFTLLILNWTIQVFLPKLPIVAQQQPDCWGIAMPSISILFCTSVDRRKRVEVLVSKYLSQRICLVNTIYLKICGLSLAAYLTRHKVCEVRFNWHSKFWSLKYWNLRLLDLWHWTSDDCRCITSNHHASKAETGIDSSSCTLP